MEQCRKIKELPKDCRPYEKCLAAGPACLTDQELLAVILRSGTKEASSLELARRILNTGSGNRNLLDLYQMSVPELMQIRGIGTVKAVQLKCIGELAKRMAVLSTRELLDFQRPETIADYYMEQLRHEGQELVICMMLNNQNQLLGDEIISKGTVNASLVSPRDVILKALAHRAVRIILIHNHPSGDATPSAEDIALTRRMEEVCSLVDIPLLDHIVIGDRTFSSLREEGIMK